MHKFHYILFIIKQVFFFLFRIPYQTLQKFGILYYITKSFDSLTFKMDNPELPKHTPQQTRSRSTAKKAID